MFERPKLELRKINISVEWKNYFSYFKCDVIINKEERNNIFYEF